MPLMVATFPETKQDDGVAHEVRVADIDGVTVTELLPDPADAAVVVVVVPVVVDEHAAARTASDATSADPTNRNFGFRLNLLSPCLPFDRMGLRHDDGATPGSRFWSWQIGTRRERVLVMVRQMGLPCEVGPSGRAHLLGGRFGRVRSSRAGSQVPTTRRGEASLRSGNRPASVVKTEVKWSTCSSVFAAVTCILKPTSFMGTSGYAAIVT